LIAKVADIFSEDAKKKIQIFHYLTIQLGHEIECDIKEQLLVKIKSSPYFALQ